MPGRTEALPPHGAGACAYAKAAAEIFELNASETRNKGVLAELLRDASDSHVISFGAAASGAASSAARPKLKRLVIMDEVDGMSGNSDRGGTQELIQVIRRHPQLKSQIQEIVQRKDLAEPAKMAAIQRIVRAAQPPDPPA